MRLYIIVFVAAAAFAAITEVSSLQTHSKASIRSLEDQINSSPHRLLRVENAAKNLDDEEERIKIPVVDKITKYLNMKTLDYYLYRNKKPKEVWNLLKLNGLKGKAYQKPNHEYYLIYLGMWKAKEAAKKAAKEVAKNAANVA